MSRFRPLRVSSLLSFALATTAMNAHASGPIELHWTAPDECPGSADVLAEVERLLGARTTVDPHVINVVANVKKMENGTFLVRLEIPGSDGTRSRQVSASSCAALGRATALILAMIVDPEAALSAPAASSMASVGASGALPGGERGQTIVDVGPPAPISTQPFLFTAPLRLPYVRSLDDREGIALTFLPARVVSRFSVTLHFLGDLGSLPGPSGGIGAGFGAFVGQLRIETGFDYFLKKPFNYSTLPNAGAIVHFFGGHAVLGYALRVHSIVEVIPRVRLDAGRFSGTSFGVTGPGEGMAFALGLGAGAAVAVRVAPSFRLSLGLDGIFFVRRPSFIVDGLGVAHEPELPVGRLALGAEVQF